jgi:hypothetical protein
MSLKQLAGRARTAFRGRGGPRPRRPVRLRLEGLEDRVTPADVFWTGAGDGLNWSDVRNWSTLTRLPGPVDDVTVNAAPGVTVQRSGLVDSVHSLHSTSPIFFNVSSLFLAADSEVDAALTLHNGTLTAAGSLQVQSLGIDPLGALAGPGDVTVTDTFTWTGGSVNGPGRLFLEGTSTVGGSSTTTLDGRTVFNDGTATVTGFGLSFPSGTWNNDAGATTVVQGSSPVGSQGPSGAFNNFGLLQKTGPGTSAFSAALNNSGTVDLQGGGMTLGTGSAGGAFSVAAGTTLDFNNPVTAGYAFLDGAAVSGAGTVRVGDFFNAITVSGAVRIQNLAVSGGTVTLNAGASLDTQNLRVDVNRSTLTGPGDLAVENDFNWTGGTLSGTGDTVLNGTAEIGGSPFPQPDSRPVDNHGTATLSSALSFSDSAVWNNDSDGTLVLKGGASLGGPLNNAGLLLKSGTGTAGVGSPFTNSGSVEVQAGALNLGTGSSLGNFNVEAGATLNISNPGAPGFAFLDGATVTGAGTFQVGTFNPSTSVTVSGGVRMQNLVITFGTLTVNPGASLDVQNLALRSGGTLTGPGDVAVENDFAWARGTLSGSGHTTLNGTTEIGDGLGGNFCRLVGRPADNHGTATLLPRTVFVVANGATWNNHSDATLVLQPGTSLGSLQGSPAGVVNNDGLIRATGSGGFAIPLNNNPDGTVDVEADPVRGVGELQLSTGGSAGTFIVGASCVLDFNGALPAYAFLDGATVSGDGRVQVAINIPVSVSGLVRMQNLQLEGGIVTVNAGASLVVQNLNLDHGALTGPGDVTVQGDLIWNLGVMSGTGRTFLEGTTTVAVSTAPSPLADRTVNNDGTATIASFGLSVQGNGTWNNDAGATTVLQGGVAASGAGPQAAFNNAGLLLKSGAGTATVGVPFNNSGTVDVQAGTLVLGTGSSSGDFNVEAGASLVISNTGAPAYAFLDGAAVTGAGTFQVGFFNLGNSITVSGAVRMQALSVNNGTVTVNAGAGLDVQNLALNLPGSTLTGPGGVTVENTFTWTGGTLSGTGGTFLNGSTTLSGQSLLTHFVGRTVDNHGTATVLTNDGLDFTLGATWNNHADATLVLQRGSSLGRSSTGGVVNNDGLVEVVGFATINVALNNSSGGTVDVPDAPGPSASGLVLTTGSSAGNFHIGSLSAVEFQNFPAGFAFLGGATSTGGGRVLASPLFYSITVSGSVSLQRLEIQGATVTVNPAASLDVQSLRLDDSSSTLTGPGGVTVENDLTWSLGTLSGTGGTTLNGTAEVGSGLLDGRIVDNHGAATLLPNANFLIAGGGTWNNHADGTLVLQSGSSVGNFFAGGAVLNNDGLVQKVGTGVAAANLLLNDSAGGTVDVEGGTLTLAGGGSSGNFKVAAGATLNFNNALTPGYDFLDGATVTGAGIFRVDLDNAITVSGAVTMQNLRLGGVATVNAGGSLTVTNLTLAGGALQGAGDVTVLGNFVWTGGTLTGTGGTFLEGTANLSGGINSWEGRTVTNDGTATFSNGGITVVDNGVWNNDAGATTIVQGGSGLNDFFRTGPGAAFNNAGLLQTAGSGTATVAVALFNTDSGTVQVQAGTVLAPGPLFHTFRTSGTVIIAPGGTLRVMDYVQTGGTTTVDGTLTVDFLGTVSLAGGLLTGGGTINGNVVNAAELRPGDSPGVLTINGNYTQTADGTLDIEIGGPAVGTQYDRLAVSGTATLAGTLNVVILNGFVPTPGTSFGVLTFRSHSGNFDTENGLDLGGGLSLVPTFNSGDTGLSLVATQSG